jgi:hypothetical protein
MTSEQAIAHASAMGARAGDEWRTSGVPSPNPFDREKFPELAAAWRRAYFKAAARRA